MLSELMTTQKNAVLHASALAFLRRSTFGTEIGRPMKNYRFSVNFLRFPRKMIKAIALENRLI